MVRRDFSFETRLSGRGGRRRRDTARHAGFPLSDAITLVRDSRVDEKTISRSVEEMFSVHGTASWVRLALCVYQTIEDSAMSLA